MCTCKPVETQWFELFTFLFQTIDNLLRCSICYEYFDVAVIVPDCSHNCEYSMRAGSSVLRSLLRLYLISYVISPYSQRVLQSVSQLFI